MVTDSKTEPSIVHDGNTTTYCYGDFVFGTFDTSIKIYPYHDDSPDPIQEPVKPKDKRPFYNRNRKEHWNKPKKI